MKRMAYCNEDRAITLMRRTLLWSVVDTIAAAGGATASLLLLVVVVAIIINVVVVVVVVTAPPLLPLCLLLSSLLLVRVVRSFSLIFLDDDNKGEKGVKWDAYRCRVDRKRDREREVDSHSTTSTLAVSSLLLYPFQAHSVVALQLDQFQSHLGEDCIEESHLLLLAPRIENWLAASLVFECVLRDGSILQYSLHACIHMLDMN